MKIVKPLRLSVLQRPFRFQGKNYLGVTVLALADMGEKPQLRPEMELWQLAAEELSLNGGVLDLAMPKACAEFLATGYAYPHNQPDGNSCAVRIDVADLSKTLAVFGDRFWQGKLPSTPCPFTEMRLDWSCAYGGEGYAENPHGIGVQPQWIDGHQRQPLPNIEAINARITSPHQKPQPASFGPLDLLWPSRFARMGKKYGDQWLINDFPGLAADTDWRVFNAASPDQWWGGRDSLPEQAKWCIWNMHPEKPVQQGHLPPWQARCFINRQRLDETRFEEIALRATTVWFFPHREQLMLFWQGSIRINEDDAADVLQLLPALEKLGASRSLNHYRKVLNQRMDKEQGALFAFREQDLLPQEVIGPWLDSDIQQQPSPMRDNMKKQAERIREQHRAHLEQNGGDITGLLAQFEEPALPKLDELPEFVEKMERQMQEMQAQAEQRKQQLAEKYPQMLSDEHKPRGPEMCHRLDDMLQKHPEIFSAQQLAQQRDAVHKLYLMSAQHQPAAHRMSADMAQIIRMRVAKAMQQGGDLSGLDLTGSDLSGMDLRGANFYKALLECADLSDCQLDGANLQEAMLARSELHHSSLRGCQLEGASLALAQCCHSDFTGAYFKQTQVQETLFDRCNFANARLYEQLFYKTWFSACAFHQAQLSNCTFIELTLPELDFSGAQLNKVTFLKSQLARAIFSGARLESCSWIECDARQTRFDSATLITCAAVSSCMFDAADFCQATLKQCNWRQMSLNDAQFALALLENCDFSEALCQRANFTHANLSGSLFIRTDFRQADLRDANLLAAILQKSRLEATNLSGSNLFRADLSQALTDSKTCMQGALCKRVKALPVRDKEIV